MSSAPSSSDLFRTENLRRRRAVNKLVELGAVAAAFLAVGILVIVVASVAKRGAGAISIDFLTKNPSPSLLIGETTESGIANAIVGTAIIIGLAVLMALPVGVLAAIYLNEFAPKRFANVLTLALDVLNGVPAIVLGIFVFVFLVVGEGQAAWKGSLALAILMLPLIARSTQEVLALVPESLREASLALGAAKWRTTLSVVLPQTIGGIVTGATLATARAAGETAPLLFTTSLVGNDLNTDPSKALASMPMFIFTSAEQADPALHEQAWGAALVLIVFILVLSVVARAAALRTRRRLAGSR
jgi:phosphate transport system permease protein